MLGNVACFLPAVFDKIFQEYTIRDSYSLDPNHVPQLYAQLPLCSIAPGGGGGYPHCSCQGGLGPAFTVNTPLNINIKNIMHTQG